MPFSQKFGAL